MIYLSLYLLFAPLSIALMLLSWVIAPFIAPLADDKGNLPRWLYYFQTFDASLQIKGTGYWDKVSWLCRNPGYGFDCFIFGLPWDKTEWTIRSYTNTESSTFWFATGRGFNLYYCGPLGTLKLGWKAWNHYSEINNCWYIDEWYNDKNWITRNPICISYNPLTRK